MLETSQHLFQLQCPKQQPGEVKERVGGRNHLLVASTQVDSFLDDPQMRSIRHVWPHVGSFCQA